MQILNNYRDKRHTMFLAFDRYFDFVLSKDDSLTVLVNGNMTKDNLCCFIDFTDSGCTTDNGINFVSDEGNTWGGALNEGVYLEDIGLCGIDNGFIKYDKDDLSFDEFYKVLTESTYELEEGDNRLHIKRVDGNTKAFSYDMSYKPQEYISLNGGFLQGFFKLEGFDYQVLPTSIDSALHLEFVMRPKDYLVKDNSLNSYNPQNSGIFFYIGARSENKFAEMHNADMSMYPIRELNREDTFLDGYLDSEVDDYSNNVTSEEEYDIDVVDSEGDSLGMYPYKEITTDNKYLFFNRTKDGFTTDTWKEENEVTLVEDKREYKDNLYLLMNRTCTGYTTDTIDKLPVSDSEKYDILSDTKDNAFALKINDDMSIGYRYLVKDCDSDNGWSIKEEYSYPNIMTKDQWNVVNVMFKIVDGVTDECGNPLSQRKMRIYIYVNGYLKFISKELPEIILKGLDDKYTRQEGVPYSISIGGGTQGMCDSVWLKYKEVYPRILPLESNFAGSFIGDIRSFKMYCGKMKYNQIKNNYLYESRQQ